MNHTDYRRELGFVFGTLLGVLLFALGVAVIILFLSVGLREDTGAFLSSSMQNAVKWAGVGFVLAGVILRLYRTKLGVSDRVGKHGSAGMIVGGFIAVLFGIGTQTTKGAPFLIDATEKVILLGIALAFLAVGALLVRGAARLVGW